MHSSCNRKPKKDYFPSTVKDINVSKAIEPARRNRRRRKIRKERKKSSGCQIQDNLTKELSHLCTTDVTRKVNLKNPNPILALVFPTEDYQKTFALHKHNRKMGKEKNNGSISPSGKRNRIPWTRM